MALMSPEDRAEQRERAVEAWAQAKRLGVAAEQLVTYARRLREDSAIRRVDALIARQGDTAGVTAGTPGVGLVVASRAMRMGVMHEALHRHLPRVWAATDPPSGVGLAITEQPDLVLVDDDLPIMTGSDAAFLVRQYAPVARVVLFSDDPMAHSRAPRDGFVVSPAIFTTEHVLSVIERLVA